MLFRSRLQAPEVVGGALAVALATPGDDGAVAAAHELLELALGLGERAGGGQVVDDGDEVQGAMDGRPQ